MNCGSSTLISRAISCVASWSPAMGIASIPAALWLLWRHRLRRQSMRMQVLMDHRIAERARAFAEPGALDLLLARLSLVARHAPALGLAVPGEAELTAALRDACEGRRSFAELRQADLPGILLGPRSTGWRPSGSPSPAAAA